MSRAHSHYYKDVRHLDEIDVYRVLDLFGVKDPCIQHAVKKLLCAGGRGAKDQERDLREAVDSINRALQMRAEDDNRMVPRPPGFPFPDNAALTGQHVATYNRGTIAAAQGIDLVDIPRPLPHPHSAMLPPRTTEQLSIDRSHLSVFAKDTLNDREVDSYQHIASGIKGTSRAD